MNAVNAREFCKRLEADLAAGRNEQECRGMVKAVLRGLALQESIKDAVLYLPKGKRQVPLRSSFRTPVRSATLPPPPNRIYRGRPARRQSLLITTGLRVNFSLRS